jgi:hypothetical protein
LYYTKKWFTSEVEYYMLEIAFYIDVLINYVALELIFYYLK